MPKIMHIITRMDMGGSAQNTLQTCLGLAEKYDMVLLHGLSLESNMTEAERRAVDDQIEAATAKGVRAMALSTLMREIDPVRDMRTFLTLMGLIRCERPDIVHTHSSKAGILGRWAAFATGVPIRVHTAHGHVFYGHFNRLRSQLFLLIERITAALTHRLVALTQGERRDYLQLGLCRADKITVVHSGVDLGRFEKPTLSGKERRRRKRALGLHPDRPVVGFAGWLLPIKGPEVLLGAMQTVWRRFADAQLVYVGKGDLKETLQKAAQKTGAGNRVFFLGWRDDLYKILPLFDLLVLPSLNEGMGRVLVEAMAAGRPVVASRTGGIPDLVVPEKNGLLVPAGDAVSLAEAICRLLAEPDTARKMGACGRRICKSYSLAAMLDKIDRLYQNLLHGEGV